MANNAMSSREVQSENLHTKMHETRHHNSYNGLSRKGADEEIDMADTRRRMYTSLAPNG